ncbi:DUF6519 domain-containing protein [Dyella choica]|uniref:Uncharacterized protein n=1 Tax=Dyella choica TaxID=1927959 RepID=A0A3S0S2J1_9GAMM|nr:DUF6519 domain-containing protein [Dyella choica]RUL78920.1 hypothetical protein EKH80_03725 [Dyella choica]
MKGDFARVTFDPANHYSQVFQQQGRVLLEADWNEQGRIQQYLLRSFITDLVGPCWASGTGFAITATDAKGNSKQLGDWKLSQGHFYVDGILCELDQDCTLATQPNLPTPDDGADGSSGLANPPPQYALWMDVWERHLSYVEAPRIADIALDGVDTASRMQTVWQLRLLSQTAAVALLKDVEGALQIRLKATTGDTTAINGQIQQIATLKNQISGSADSNETDTCALIRDVLNARNNNACPQLTAELKSGSADGDPCSIAADARYSGCENQLYRVEIHDKGLPGSGGASFKWSRENGSVIFPITSASTPTVEGSQTKMTVTLASLGRDDRLGLAVGDWVELVDDAYTLRQQASPLLQVAAIEIPARIVTLQTSKTQQPYGVTLGKRPYVRRWDQQKGASQTGAIPVMEGADGAVELESGVLVTFQPGGLYATGDYWVIAARVADGGSLDWPTQDDGSPKPLSASGLHHYAVLGLHDEKNAYKECCCRFGPLCTRLRQTSAQSTDAIANVASATGKVAASGRSAKTASTPSASPTPSTPSASPTPSASSAPSA